MWYNFMNNDMDIYPNEREILNGMATIYYAYYLLLAVEVHFSDPFL